MIKACIFDLDDTLYPEREYVMSGFKAVARHMSERCGRDFNAYFDVLRDGFAAGLRGNNFDDVKNKTGAAVSVGELVRVYREHPPEITLYVDARKILSCLRGRYKLGLISDGSRPSQLRKLDSLGIASVFDEIIINDLEAGESKHKSESFERMLVSLEVVANEAVYIGDNPVKDVEAPKGLGFLTVLVNREDGLYSGRGETLNADHVLDNLDDLCSVLG